MPPDPIEDLPPHDRRRFFSAGLSRMLRPFADYIEKKLPPALLPVERTVLRPPGALTEADFLDTCYRCARCADACPANAIAITKGLDDKQYGTPIIKPQAQACVICDDLSCMKVCPSGALRLVDRFAIRMGLAKVDHDLCVRSRGESCTVCIEKCPIADVAIGIDAAGRIRVTDPAATGLGCTGCGLCEQNCPTRPTRAITVNPYAF